MIRRTACVGLFFAVCTGAAWAQSTLGTILGTVTDASGAVIANCDVKNYQH